jgi:phospholipase/carboxylesterase
VPEPLPLQVHIDASDAPTGLLVLVHGFAHTEHHTAVAGRLIDPERRFTVVAPRGPIHLPTRKTAAWVLPRRRRPEQFGASLLQLDAFVEAQCREHGIGRDRVVLGGFSQGAILSVALAAMAGRPLPLGLIVWCGTVPVDRGVEVDLGRLAGVPVLWQMATHDEVISLEVVRAGAEQLRAVGAAIDAREYDARHEVSLDMLNDARDWLARRG